MGTKEGFLGQVVGGVPVHQRDACAPNIHVRGPDEIGERHRVAAGGSPRELVRTRSHGRTVPGTSCRLVTTDGREV